MASREESEIQNLFEIQRLFHGARPDSLVHGSPLLSKLAVTKTTNTDYDSRKGAKGAKVPQIPLFPPNPPFIPL